MFLVTLLAKNDEVIESSQLENETYASAMAEAIVMYEEYPYKENVKRILIDKVEG